MRTALGEIRLFNDKSIMHNRVFISKQNMCRKSKIAERMKERECERQSVAGNER
jgi:hypothetical protein